MSENDDDKDADYSPTEEQQKRALRLLVASPTKFCSNVLNFKPFPYQIKMLEDPSKNIIACAARRVGKSLIMAMKALWFAFCHPCTSTLIVAATQRQSMLMFDRLLDTIASTPLLEQSVVRRTRTLLRFTNGSRIVALPCGKTGQTIRGENANLIIVDEASFVPEDVILSVMMPMLSTTDGTMIMLSTPWSRDHFFYRAFNSPLWSEYRFKTSDNPLVKKEFLDQQRDMIGERRFRQEYLAEFVEDEKTCFPMSLLRPCVHLCGIRNGEAETCEFCSMNLKMTLPNGELYAGYDPGGLTNPAALVVVQKVPRRSVDASSEETMKKMDFSPAFRVVLTKSFALDKKKKKTEEHDNDLSNDVDADIYTHFNIEIADLHKKAHLRRLLLDSTGIGRPILSQCRELGLPVEGIIMHAQHKEEIFSNLKILLETRKVELPDNLELLSSLNSVISEPTRTGGYSFSHESGTHDDLAFALALALWTGGKGGSIIIINKDEPSRSNSWRISEG